MRFELMVIGGGGLVCGGWGGWCSFVGRMCYFAMNARAGSVWIGAPGSPTLVVE